MKPIRSITLAALMSAAVFAQAPLPRVEFEVASIRPSAPIVDRATAGLHLDGAQVNFVLLSLNDYLGAAYKIKSYQISGPDWMASERFDINAKLPAGSKSEQIPEMLQALLADRFGMKFHKEMKDFPVYALIQGKGGLKMKELPPEPLFGDGGGDRGPVSVVATGSAAGTTIDFGHGSYMTFGNNTFEGHKLPASAIADTLARFLDRPVVDLSELKGNYDFTLQFTPEDYRAMMIRAAIAAGATLPPEALKLLDLSSGDSLFSALETVGLKLDKRRAPVEVVVIDHMEKSPTSN